MAERLFLGQILLICLIILGGGQAAMAQNASNPFDLEHRLDNRQQKPDSTAADSENPFDIESRQEDKIPVEKAPIPVNLEANNPFDIQRANSELDKKEQNTSEQIVDIPEKTITKPKDTRSGFLFWTILGMMIFLALLITLYRSLLVKIYRAFANENILKLLQREQSGVVSAPYLFFYVLFFLSAGIFAFQVAYRFEIISFELENLGYCILGIAAFFLLKHLCLMVISYVFPVSREAKQYSFTIITFSIILGIVLIPFNISIAFAQDSLTNPGIIGAFIAIAAIYLYRVLRGIFIGSKFLAFHKFHFFMYICTIEIAPLLILIKLLLNGANIH